MKQTINNYLVLLVLILLLAGTGGCKKYLDAKPDKKLVVPATLQDLQSLLDFGPATLNDPGCDEVSADNYYLNTNSYLALPGEGDRNMYTWQKEQIFQSYANDWSDMYRRIYYVNTVLETLTHIERTPLNQTIYDNVKGQALLLRGKSFLLGAIIWATAYDKTTAATDMGLPLKVTADFTAASVRSSLQATFDLLLNDLASAVALLPVKPLHVSRVSRPARSESVV